MQVVSDNSFRLPDNSKTQVQNDETNSQGSEFMNIIQQLNYEEGNMLNKKKIQNENIQI